MCCGKNGTKDYSQKGMTREQRIAANFKNKVPEQIDNDLIVEIIENEENGNAKGIR